MSASNHNPLPADRDQPRLSVVIPVRNEGDRIAATLRSIVECRSGHFPLEIVVVDDACTDGCCDALETLYPHSFVRIKLIRLPRWSGIPFARNAGAGVATAPLLFITDGNVIFPPNWDLTLCHALGLTRNFSPNPPASPNRVLCAAIADASSSFIGYGCTLLLPSMGIAWLTDPHVCNGYVPISPCTGTILSADLFRRVGGYDTAMPIYGAAEPEFSVRLWLSGAEIVPAPGLILNHRFRPAAERQPFLEAISLVQLCNYLRFGFLYLDEPRREDMLAYYSASSPSLFPEAMARVTASDVGQRRRLLEERLPGRFAAFAERFRLTSLRPDGLDGNSAISQSATEAPSAPLEALA